MSFDIWGFLSILEEPRAAYQFRINVEQDERVSINTPISQ